MRILNKYCLLRCQINLSWGNAEANMKFIMKYISIYKYKANRMESLRRVNVFDIDLTIQWLYRISLSLSVSVYVCLICDERIIISACYITTSYTVYI